LRSAWLPVIPWDSGSAPALGPDGTPFAWTTRAIGVDENYPGDQKTERSSLMEHKKYIGMDVYQATISLAVMDSAGKVGMESVIETKAATILEYFQGLRGSLWVTFEEGTSATWLYDLLRPHVEKVVVCDPRKDALLKGGNKNDRVDARKLADLLRSGLLSPVYHEESGVRLLKELARSYLTLTKDLSRVMNRTKGLYRS
jgi:hypothetical protein